MVTEEHPGRIPCRILRESDLGEVHFSQVSTIQIHIKKLHRLDNFERHGLEIMSEMTAKPM
jgi:hypothetical protein